MEKELKDRLMNLLKDREEVASEFQDRHDDGEWEEALDLAIEWWQISEEIDSIKRRIAGSVAKPEGGD